MFDNYPEIKARLLVHEAKRWIGIKEQGGDNKGQVVEMFQKAVDGKAAGEPWCMAFVQFCIKQVDEAFDVIANECIGHSIITPTEHCMTLWRNHLMIQRQFPAPGDLVFWKFGDTDNGHVGIVESFPQDNIISTIEGNTADGLGVVREGNGVYNRKRTMGGSAEMKMLGFIRPWI